MAKAEKMNRGVSSKAQRGGGTELKLPQGVHSFDSHGNIFASLPELSRVTPKYFTMEEIKAAFAAGKLTSLTGDDINEIERLMQK
ncbi:MAG: hypothetical protein MUC50_09625 [Myxococcota bacterium]|jgi:hypothetical protein|nr:hypothetical protein [Myxococcota bacterium]